MRRKRVSSVKEKPELSIRTSMLYKWYSGTPPECVNEVELPWVSQKVKVTRANKKATNLK